jgi:plastocyanin
MSTMLHSTGLRRTLSIAAYAVGALGLVSGATAALAPHMVSQKAKTFMPSAMTVAVGDGITLVNDDEGVIHHAYVEDEAFSYDSGDQDPGSRSQVTFTKAGTFTVLCGIHPRMKLVVEVK